MMKQFGTQTIAAMQTALEEVYRHIPPRYTSACTLVAASLLECASNGEKTYASANDWRA
jgi:hypothetical protein